MKIYAARHGRTNYNDLGLCNADPAVDVHLTDTGKLQAEALGEKLSQVRIDQIYVSEHRRTQQTAEFVNKFHNAPIKIDARLNDNRTGYEGKPASEYNAALNAASNKWSVRLNDGESLEDVIKRVGSFLDELKAQKHTVVLIITSEVIVEAIGHILQGLPNEEAFSLEIEQGSYIELDS